MLSVGCAFPKQAESGRVALMEEATDPFLDTHTNVQELVTVGVPEAQAEILVRQYARSIAMNSATKADIAIIHASLDEFRLETKAHIEKSQQETNAHLKTLQQETKAGIETLRQETKTDIAALHADIDKVRLETTSAIETLRQETKADIAALHADVDKVRLETRANIEKAKSDTIKWVAGSYVAAVVSLAGIMLAAARLLSQG